MLNTKQLIEQWPGLSDDTRRILLTAVSTRGKFKGYLLANSPSQYKQPEKWAAWQALVSYLAPVRVSISGLMFGDKGLFNDLDREIDKTGLGSVLQPVEPPMRWNLYSWRHDIDAERKAIAAWLEKRAANVNVTNSEGVAIGFADLEV